MHDLVVREVATARGYGVSTAQGCIAKREVLRAFLDHWEGPCAIILADPIRTVPTLLVACLQGIQGLVVSPKGGTPTATRPRLTSLALKIGAVLIEAGELHGRPIEGTAFGNSPSKVPGPEVLRGALVHFYSSNLGSLMQPLLHLVTQSKRRAATYVYLASFVNAAALVKRLVEDGTEALIIATGGFYEMISLEDFLLGGKIFTEIGFDASHLDDEARAMMLAYSALATDDDLVTEVRSCGISRWLERLGKDADVECCAFARCRHISTCHRASVVLPRLEWIDGIPVFVPRFEMGSA